MNAEDAPERWYRLEHINPQHRPPHAGVVVAVLIRRISSQGGIDASVAEMRRVQPNTEKDISSCCAFLLALDALCCGERIQKGDRRHAHAALFTQCSGE